MKIQWYSPHSAHWSRVHISRRDWLDSNPDSEVTVCGRRPRKQHSTVVSAVPNSNVPMCNQCRKGTPQ